MKNILEHVRNLIALGKLGNALAVLAEYLMDKDRELYIHALAQQANIAACQRKARLGLISLEEEFRFQNNFCVAILQLVDDAELLEKPAA